MMKNRRHKILVIFIVVIVLICGVIFLGKTEKRDNDIDNSVELPVGEKNDVVKESLSPDIDDKINKGELVGTREPVNTRKPVVTDEVEDTRKPIETNQPEISDDKTDVGELVSTKESANTKKPASTKEPISTKEPDYTENKSDFNITLNAPEIALAGATFEVSIETTNCVHVEWYINGEYDLSLEKKINPKGSLQFSKAGIYRVTVIGYTQDWSENVSDEKYIRVYTDLSQANGNAKEHDRAMYSWSHHYIYPENEAMLQKVMEITECNILYQEIAPNAAARDVAAFLKRRNEHNQTVYYLCGNATWAIEKDGKSMLEQVERAVEYNKAAGGHKFIGIQFDVEPYCLLDFEENADAYMVQYVKNSKLAYEAAHKEGLLVEICSPYWWDSSYGYEEELEDLIANACDSVAVMNYYKNGKEIAHIENELTLCKKYNKRIINITETIPAGQHGLTENNTYYNDGIDAIEEMWNTLDGFFQYDKLGYSFHYLDIIIEMLGLS